MLLTLFFVAQQIGQLLSQFAGVIRFAKQPTARIAKDFWKRAFT